MKNLSYPFTSLNNSKENNKENLNREKIETSFKTTISRLFKIESSAFNLINRDNNSNKKNDFETSLIKLLIKPLKIKFRYHFMSNRITNTLDKVKLN